MEGEGCICGDLLWGSDMETREWSVRTAGRVCEGCVSVSRACEEGSGFEVEDRLWVEAPSRRDEDEPRPTE